MAQSPVSIAGYSSRGPTAYDGLKPDLLAPGWYLTSAEAETTQGVYSCHVQAFRGTSMSAPAIAGFAVKIIQYFQEGYYPRSELHLR